MKPLAIAISIAFLAACSGPMEWIHPTATQQDFAKDRYACIQEATVVLPGTPYIPPPRVSNPSPAGAFVQGLADGAAFGASQGGVVKDGQLFEACMQARGYSARPVN